VDSFLDDIVDNLFWTLHIDGSNSNDSEGAGCILASPKNEKSVLTYKIEFEYTNNVEKYEALIQEMKKAISLEFKFLKLFGDLEIVIK